MSNQMDQAIQSIIDLHVLIENVFTGKNAEQSLGPLLDSLIKILRWLRFKVRVLA